MLSWVLLYVLFFLIWRRLSSQTTSIYASINFIEVLISFTNSQPPKKCQQKHFTQFQGVFCSLKEAPRDHSNGKLNRFVLDIDTDLGSFLQSPLQEEIVPPWKLKHPEYWWLEDDISCSNGTYAGDMWFLFWGNHQHVVKGSVNMKSSNVAKTCHVSVGGSVRVCLFTQPKIAFFVKHFFQDCSHLVRLSFFLLLTTTSATSLRQEGGFVMFCFWLWGWGGCQIWLCSTNIAGWKSTLLYSKKRKMVDFRMQFCFFTRGVHLFSIENHQKSSSTNCQSSRTLPLPKKQQRKLRKLKMKIQEAVKVLDKQKSWMSWKASG